MDLVNCLGAHRSQRLVWKNSDRKLLAVGKVASEPLQGLPTDTIMI